MTPHSSGRTHPSHWRKVITLLCLAVIAAGCIPATPAITPETPAVRATSVTPSPTVLASFTPTIPVISPSPSPTETSVPPPPAQRPHYSLQLTFDYTQHSAAIQEQIDYTNNTDEDLPTLALVVEANHYPGVFHLDSIQLPDGRDFLNQITINDHRLDVPLAEPLRVAQSVTLILRYHLQLPAIPPPEDNHRPVPFGYSSRQTNLVDWYPYVAATLPGKGWQIHDAWVFGEHQVQEAADYQVELILTNPPAGLQVAASTAAEGIIQGNKLNYSLEAGRSFAISASPIYQVDSMEADGVTVTSYSFPWDVRAGKATLEDTAKALVLYNRLFGPYPRHQLSVVEADFLDGMEYEGLYFLSRGFYNLYDGTPRGYLTTIAVHETAHQWWYAKVGNDQALEPWLDEGISTYSERIFFENIYPELSDWWWAFRVNFYSPVGDINRPIYDYTGFTPYRDAVYLRSALFLEDLRIRTGDEAFFAFLKDYATRYAGKIATAKDFFAVLKEHSSADISGLLKIYFNQTSDQ